jgi:hypothetical protein
MSRTLFKLARSMSARRAARPRSREEILRALLGMRAAADRAGLVEVEAQLRNQIRWCLPIHYPPDVEDLPPPPGEAPVSIAPLP